MRKTSTETSFFDTQGNNDCAIHYHQNIEIIQMLEGCIEITVRGNAKRLMPGEFAIISSYEPHGFFTVGSSKFNVIVPPCPHHPRLPLAQRGEPKIGLQLHALLPPHFC